MNIFNSLGSNYSLKSGAYSLRPSNRHAPTRLATFLKNHYQAPQVHVTYKGREALAIVLQALELPKGSYVAINGYTCFAVYQAVTAAGLAPYYLDIEKDELNFTPKTLSKALQNQPDIKAVIIQNTLGLPADVEAIQKICKKEKVALIEDLAHCIGLEYPGGKEAGTVGTAAALSFSQDKMIDAVTGGAAILHQKTAPKNLTYRSANLWHRFTTRLYPWATPVIRATIKIGIGKILLKTMKIVRLLPGPMSGAAAPAQRLPCWHSSLVVKAYEQLPGVIEHRRHIAAIYRETLPPEVQVKHTEEAVYLRFPLLVKAPHKLINHLKQFGIYIGDRWYDAPVAPKRSLSGTSYQAGQCPHAEYVAEHMINLPTHIHVSDTEAKIVAEKVHEWLKSQ